MPERTVVILAPYGSLFFAAAAPFEQQLPEVTERSDRAVVILILRGKTDMGSTFTGMVAMQKLQAKLQAHPGRA
ncbi:MAG: hypothetical protein U0556_13220 [Dehalococcoidia bacterium]